MEVELKELGFTDNEVKIYLALLRNGQLNPTSLAEKTGLHRSYIYDACEKLLERGVISTTLVNGRKQFRAADPKTLAESIELRLRTAQELLPKLTTMYKERQEESGVELQHGARVYRTIIKELTAAMQRKDEILLIGVDEKALDSVEPIYLKQYFRILKERQATERIIIPKGSRQLKIKHLQYTEADRREIGETITVIHRNTTYFFVKGDPHKLVIIRDNAIANTHRRHFEMLWNRLNTIRDHAQRKSARNKQQSEQ